LYRFREALSEYMNLARLGNKYLADEEPWKLIKTDEQGTKNILYVALQIASALASLGEPFIPFSADKLAKMLNTKLQGWDTIAEGELLVPGHQINGASLLFEKVEDEAIQKQLDRLEATKKANEVVTVEAQKEAITFEDFTSMDIRIGTILEAEKVKKANKLLQIKVDTGIDVRTIVSGIAESFSPEEVIGKQVSVLVNLAPRKIRGVESQGMILMTENADGKLVFVAPTESVNNGMDVS
jgi:methionyl-tRNA synthetase